MSKPTKSDLEKSLEAANAALAEVQRNVWTDRDALRAEFAKELKRRLRIKHVIGRDPGDHTGWVLQVSNVSDAGDGLLVQVELPFGASGSRKVAEVIAPTIAANVVPRPGLEPG